MESTFHALDEQIQKCVGHQLELQRSNDWKKFERKHDFFHNVEMAKDGGHEEIHTLFSSFSRWVSALLALLFMAMNIYTILTSAFTNLYPSKGHTFFETWTRVDDEEDPTLIERFISTIVCRGHRPCSHRELNPLVLVSLAELYLLASCLVRAMIHFLKFINWQNSEPVRWHACADLFWGELSQVSTISAMRMLYFVTPAVLIADITHCLHLEFHHKAPPPAAGTPGGSREFRESMAAPLASAASAPPSQTAQTAQPGQPLVLAMQEPAEPAEPSQSSGSAWKELGILIFSRLAYGYFGIEVFLLKLVETERKLDILTGLVFLNQILGIMRVSMFVHDRIMLFIFSGEEGQMDREELKLMGMWHAMLAKWMWEAYSLPKFVALMLTFSDKDVQQLVLNTKQDKQRRASEVELGSRIMA